MDEVNKIRKSFFTQGENKHQIAQDFTRSWATVDTVIKTPQEELLNRGKRPGRKRVVITAEVEKAINEIFDIEDALKVKKKQQHTSQCIYDQLVAKDIYKGKPRALRYAVNSIRKQRAQSRQTSYLPLKFALGSTIQVDHGEVEIILNNQRVTGYLFVASVPGSSISYTQFFPLKSMEAWGEFHERMFLFFKGIFPTVIYDNDSVLVKEIIGSDRKQTGFSHSLEEHYGFKSRFCNKGSGNEKGSVENAVGYCRRNYLSGIQEFAGLMAVNKYLESKCQSSLDRTHYKTGVTLSSLYLEISDKLEPMTSAKSWVKWEDARVDPYQTVSVKKHKYSVPKGYVSSSVRLAIGFDQINIFHDHKLITSHPRQFIQGSDSLSLDHYLDQLKIKPGALWDCKAVQSHDFEEELMILWDRLKNRLKSRTANKEFINILMLRRSCSQDLFITAVGLGLEFGAVEYSSISNILLQLTNPSPIYPGKEWLEDALPQITANNYSFEIDLKAYSKLVREVSYVS